MTQVSSSRQPWGIQLRPEDAGIGLVEVILAMLLLVITALGVLPLLMVSSKLAVVNRDMLAATGFANSRLSTIRDAFPDSADSSCAQVATHNASNISDPAGTALIADVIVDACPSVYPDAMTVRARSVRLPRRR